MTVESEMAKHLQELKARIEQAKEQEEQPQEPPSEEGGIIEGLIDIVL